MKTKASSLVSLPVLMRHVHPTPAAGCCMVALSMADGYARYTSKPQCVIVHVDVGTQGLGAAVHNASCGRAPVLIFAGLSPYTIEGEARGSRTEYIHWIQDVPDQKQIVAQYCRYTGEVKTGRNVKQIVRRALQFATSAPCGPVYLCGAREAMEEDIEPYKLVEGHWDSVAPAALTQEQVKKIADALVGAKEPLLITGYCGRNHAAVEELVKLVETVKGLRVLDTGGSDMCFPADHRASLGLRYGVDESIKTADVILVVDCDVPWIPTQCKPKIDAKVFHIDIDPLKQQMPVFYIAAEARYRADSYTTFKQLHEYIENDESLSKTVATYGSRWNALAENHSKRMQIIRDLAKPGDDGNYNVSYLTAAVRKAVPADTIFAIEAVTNTVFVADQIQATLPGSWINCGGGGLGWSGGGALGIKLATEAEGGKKFVCQIVGDGTFLFSVPGSVYWISQRYQIPILTIILNNRGWNAPRKSLLLVHPDGLGSKVSNDELNIAFTPTPDYAGIAKAAAGGSIWAEHASTTEELGKLLPQAVEAVMQGRGAVLDAHLDGPQGKYGGGKELNPSNKAANKRGIATAGNYLIAYCGQETSEVNIVLTKTQTRLHQVIHTITDIHPNDMTDVYYSFFSRADRNVVSTMLNNIANGTYVPVKGYLRRPALRCINPADTGTAADRCKRPGTHILTTKSGRVVYLCPSFRNLQLEPAKANGAKGPGVKGDCLQTIGRGDYLPLSKVVDHQLTVLTEALVRLYLHGAENGREVENLEGCLELGKGHLEGRDAAVNPRSYGFFVGKYGFGYFKQTQHLFDSYSAALLQLDWKR
ncbi:MAG: hypothetical protein Q9187_000305 [Circinaria calcarea]